MEATAAASAATSAASSSTATCSSAATSATSSSTATSADDAPTHEAPPVAVDNSDVLSSHANINEAASISPHDVAMPSLMTAIAKLLEACEHVSSMSMAVKNKVPVDHDNLAVVMELLEQALPGMVLEPVADDKVPALQLHGGADQEHSFFSCLDSLVKRKDKALMVSSLPNHAFSPAENKDGIMKISLCKDEEAGRCPKQASNFIKMMKPSNRTSIDGQRALIQEYLSKIEIRRRQLHALQLFCSLDASFLADTIMNVCLVDATSKPSQNATNRHANRCDKRKAAGERHLRSTLEPLIKLLEEVFRSSLGSGVRQDLHVAKIVEFRGCGPDPAPDWIPCQAINWLAEHGEFSVKESFNPLFDFLCLPWAQEVEYYHARDVAMVCCQETTLKGHQLKDLANVCFSWAIPIRSVLEYMIEMAPKKRIAEIGSGLGYWAALLKKLGADVIAVDNFTEKTSPGAPFFPGTLFTDGEHFIKQGGAHNCALFFCWPRKDDPLQQFTMVNACKQSTQKATCLAEACLNVFHGDIVFFVGERGDGCTFDIAAWMTKTPKRMQTWRLVKEIDIPSWPGINDVFMCYVKQQEPLGNPSLCKKKKKTTKKAWKVNKSYLPDTQCYKEENNLKAEMAAYSNCSLQ